MHSINFQIQNKEIENLPITDKKNLSEALH